MNRPNPEGWKGGSEDFDCVWTLYGHRSQSTGAYLNDSVSDPGHDVGIDEATGRHHTVPDGGMGCGGYEE
jgi:hypothetical protein